MNNPEDLKAHFTYLSIDDAEKRLDGYCEWDWSDTADASHENFVIYSYLHASDIAAVFFRLEKSPLICEVSDNFLVAHEISKKIMTRYKSDAKERQRIADKYDTNTEKEF